MASKAREFATQDVKADMTPMIDVTFLLIIFFMCSIKFRVLEGKLETYLPKNVGVNAAPQEQMLETIDIRITRNETRDQVDLDDVDVFRDWEWDFDQIAVALQGKPMASLDELSRELKTYRGNIPAPPPGDEDTLKLNIEAMDGVLYEDVVKIVDVALDAKFTSITFRGIEMDS